MTNMFDYLKWRGDVTFDAYPINEVDSVIFSQLSYVPFDKIVSSEINSPGKTIEEIYDMYFSNPDKKINLGAIIPAEKIVPLFSMMSHSARFKDVRVRAYINEVDKDEEKQLCAMCFDLPNGNVYVAFRGTDDNLVSWKEDLNMALFTPIPAQKDAVEYLTKICQATNEKIYIGGHSKGGNLAVYSAFMIDRDLQGKIAAVHSFDGPGFREDFLEITNTNPVMRRKITNFLPQGSIVGSIFDTIGRDIYVKSNATGLFQHDTFSWYLERINFITVPSLSRSSIQFHTSLKQWVAELTDEEKRSFVEAFFKLCDSCDAATLSDILTNKTKFIGALFKADGTTKKTMFKTVGKSVKSFLGIKKSTPAGLTKEETQVLQKAHLLEGTKKLKS